MTKKQIFHFGQYVHEADGYAGRDLDRLQGQAQNDPDARINQGIHNRLDFRSGYGKNGADNPPSGHHFPQLTHWIDRYPLASHETVDILTKCGDDTGLVRAPGVSGYGMSQTSHSDENGMKISDPIEKLFQSIIQSGYIVTSSPDSELSKAGKVFANHRTMHTALATDLFGKNGLDSLIPETPHAPGIVNQSFQGRFRNLVPGKFNGGPGSLLIKLAHVNTFTNMPLKKHLVNFYLIFQESSGFQFFMAPNIPNNWARLFTLSLR